MKPVRPITIAITAMGGQGGGVLAGWITQLAESQNYIAQSTSVPGVAQRTGATIYYVELFPKEAAKKAGRAPVLALMPLPGDVDIVIASEMMEAGRALMRGFVTKRTTLIASTHRIYAISEKEPLGDGRQDLEAVQKLAEDTAGRFIGFDMEAAAQSAQSFISSVLFGALAGSDALPFSRDQFTAVIRKSGKAVKANLSGFALGYAKGAGQKDSIEPEAGGTPASTTTPLTPAPAIAPLLAHLHEEFSPATHDMLRLGLERVVDFQDVAYGTLYLDRMSAIHALDKAYNGARKSWRLSKAVARYLALAMAYEDTIRIADLKTRSSRFDRFANEVGAKDGQIITITEFMHPRVEEICDILPVSLGRFMLQNKVANSALGFFFAKGRKIKTTSVGGFLLLYTLAAFKPIRRASLRFMQEQKRMDHWLDAITNAAPVNYALACEIAGMQRLIKGYGDTHARGLKNYQSIMAALDTIGTDRNANKRLQALKEAALQHEDGQALKIALEKY